MWRLSHTWVQLFSVFCIAVFSFLFFPVITQAHHCEGTVSSASGYLFDAYEVAEYSDDGWLTVHLKLKPPYNDGRSWTLHTGFKNDECERGTLKIYNFSVSIPDDIEFWSIRYKSWTEIEIWNDEDEILIDTVNVDQYPEYFEVHFGGSIGPNIGGSRFATESYRIRDDVSDPPIRTEKLPPPDVCTNTNVDFNSTGYLFDDYESTEYADGFIRWYLRLKSPRNDNRIWNFGLTFYDENCQFVGAVLENDRVSPAPYARYYSVRFISPTEYEIWNDETETLVWSVDLSGRIPDNAVYTVFRGHIDAGASYVNTTPFPISEGQDNTDPDPVIVIPGILGSWEKNGKWVIDPVLHTYDDLLRTFELNGFVRDETIFSFPYDWKNSNVFTAGLLRDKINEVQEICDCEKVDIVAHSMGGLVARYYIQSGLYEDDVDQLVFLGTPHLGSPKAYLTWEGGEIGTDLSDNLLEFRISRSAYKDDFSSLFGYIRNKPIISINQLLPVFDYLIDKETNILRNYPNGYPRNTFLENLNANIQNLFDSGVNITNIVGELDEDSTISAFRVVDSPELPKWDHGYPDGYDSPTPERGFELEVGDKTVPKKSSEILNVVNEISNFEHKELVFENRSKVFEKLTGYSPDITSDIGLYFDGIALLVFDIRSPVDVQVVSPDGSQIGKDFETGEEINEIEGAFYSGFETGNEYITISNPVDGEYKIVTQGTDNGGEYTVVTGFISDEDLVVDKFTSYTLPNNVEEIILELDNNKVVSEEVTEITIDTLETHILEAYELGWISNEELEDKLIKLIGKIEKIDKILEEKFTKELDKGFNKGDINFDGYNLLKEDVILLIK